jgi:hypothetical protein
MNKKIVHLFTNKLPIVSIILLTLSYAYLSIPDNYTLQIGGVAVANTFKLPANVPWKYKYRWVLVLIPFLFIIHIIYAASITSRISSLSVWDFGIDFFSQFQINAKKAVDNGAVEGPDAKNFNYKIIDPSATEDRGIKKLFNIIQLSADPKSNLNKEAQYFCNTLRRCNCCSFPAYTNKFPNMKDTCNNFKSPDS